MYLVPCFSVVIVKVNKFCRIQLFVDDIANNAEAVQGDLENLENWLKFKNLKFNFNKTKAMLFNVNRDCGVRYIDLNSNIGSQQIKVVNNIKYLDVVIDKLKFRKHVDFTAKKT